MARQRAADLDDRRGRGLRADDLAQRRDEGADLRFEQTAGFAQNPIADLARDRRRLEPGLVLVELGEEQDVAAVVGRREHVDRGEAAGHHLLGDIAHPVGDLRPALAELAADLVELQQLQLAGDGFAAGLGDTGDA